MKSKKMKPPATSTSSIQWPAHWAANEGWPTDTNATPLTSEKRTWGELDESVRAQGTSLEESATKMGKPKRATRKRATAPAAGPLQVGDTVYWVAPSDTPYVRTGDVGEITQVQVFPGVGHWLAHAKFREGRTQILSTFEGEHWSRTKPEAGEPC